MVLCKNCGFTYQNPQLTAKYLATHYKGDSSGNVFREKTKEFRTASLVRERVKFIKKYIIADSGNIIDIGGGQGDLLKNLHLPKWKKHLLEPSDAVSQIKKESDITVYNEKIEHFNPGKHFDAVLCISALEHFKNPLDVIKEFSLLLTTRGYLFIEVPDSLKPKEQVAEFYSYEHLSHFTKYTLTKALMKHSLFPVFFDQNISIPNIRVVAQKKASCAIDIPNDVDLLKNSINLYRSRRKLFIDKIKKKLIPGIEKIRSKNKKIAIYGTGDHSKFLIEEFNIKNLILNFIDSNPAKWGKLFYDITIDGPESIMELNVEAIIISSHDFETEIIKTIKKYNKHNIKIITLYADQNE